LVPGLPVLFAAMTQCAAAGTKSDARGFSRHHAMEAAMGFGRGALLWLLGVPLPIILILALFMHR
jgi:hypothetical protein